MSSEWPLWEVFIRGQHGLNHRHVGSLHAPDADMGDLAFANGFMAGCVEVTIDNADVSGADFALNINIPF